VREFRGADPVGQAGGWLILLLAAEQLPGGSWAYTYSVRPGVNVMIMTWPGPDMLPPHDDTYARIAAQLARRATGGP
jgi:hypothetical protein